MSRRGLQQPANARVGVGRTRVSPAHNSLSWVETLLVLTLECVWLGGPPTPEPRAVPGQEAWVSVRTSIPGLC